MTGSVSKLISIHVCFDLWYLEVDLASLAESMSYKPLTVEEPAKNLPLKWFEAHPVIGSKLASGY